MASKAIDALIQFLTADSRFWLSPGVTWEALQDPGENNVLKPLPRHLIYVVVVTFALLLFRFFFERFIALPIGRWLGVEEKKASGPNPNAVLEKAFKRASRPKGKDIVGLAKAVDWSERKVECWFQQRRRMDIPSTMMKFREGMWRMLCYFSLLTAGVFIVPKKPYWKVTANCYADYPKKGIETDIFWYYVCELSFYTSLTISQFTDIKRKDFWQMLMHHAATITLICFSYLTNYVAIGALIMFVHDWADPWLELAKVIGYIRKPNEGRSHKQTVADIIFVIFMLTFWFSRLYFYPTHCISCVYYEMAAILGPPIWPMYYVLILLLTLLWMLHVFWSYQILRVLIFSIMAGKVKGDVRSDDESE